MTFGARNLVAVLLLTVIIAATYYLITGEHA